jgi:hypothetical protein
MFDLCISARQPCLCTKTGLPRPPLGVAAARRTPCGAAAPLDLARPPARLTGAFTLAFDGRVPSAGGWSTEVRIPVGGGASAVTAQRRIQPRHVTKSYQSYRITGGTHEFTVS